MKPNQNPHFTKLAQLTFILTSCILAFGADPIQARPLVQATEQAVACNPYNNIKVARLAIFQGLKPDHLLQGNVYADCPSNKQTCTTSMQVQPKQQLLVFKQYKQYTCVLSINPELSGWIQTNRLTINSAPPKKVTNIHWQGWWRDSNQLRSIEIKPEKNGKLSVVGNGAYHGHYFDSQGIAHAEPYHRNFRFTAQMNNNPFTYQSQPYRSSWAEITQEASTIDFLLIGNYLIINDMLNLGGNVNFSAIYQKYHAKPTSKK